MQPPKRCVTCQNRTVLSLSCRHASMLRAFNNYIHLPLNSTIWRHGSRDTTPFASWCRSLIARTTSPAPPTLALVRRNSVARRVTSTANASMCTCSTQHWWRALTHYVASWRTTKERAMSKFRGKRTATAMSQGNSKYYFVL